MSVWRPRIENLRELLSWLEENEPGLELLEEQAESETDMLKELEDRLDMILQMQADAESDSQTADGESSGPTSKMLASQSSEQSPVYSNTVASTEIRLAKPATQMAMKMGADMTTALLTFMNATGFPDGWEIRKNEHGVWGLYSPKAVGMPLCYFVDREFDGFQWAMATMAAFWCAHALFDGQLDARAVSDSVRMS